MLRCSHCEYKYKRYLAIVSTSTSGIVALKVLLSKQTFGEKLSTLSDMKAFIEACYQNLLHAAHKTRSKYSTPHQFRPV